MKYLSVCSGIEAATVAWHPLGWEPVGFSEIDPFASAVLAHHYPNTPNLGDMTQYANWKLPAFDLLVGGTPCQSFSVAGLRKGLEDPRGNLMLVYLGILDRFRPRWCVWENVPGVLSSNGGRDFGTFLGSLGELGYGFAYRVLDAQFVRVESHPRAVPQRRQRVFVVGCVGDDWRSAAEVLLEPEGVRGDSGPRRQAGKATPAVARRGPASGEVGPGVPVKSWGINSDAVDRSGEHADGTAAKRSGLGISLEVQPTLKSRPTNSVVTGATVENLDHSVPDIAQTEIYSIQDTREANINQGGVGISQEGVSYTLTAMLPQGVVTIEPNTGDGVMAINFQGSKGNSVVSDDGSCPTLAAMHGSDVHVVAVPSIVNIEHGLAPHGRLEPQEVSDPLTQSEFKGHSLVLTADNRHIPDVLPTLTANLYNTEGGWAPFNETQHLISDSAVAYNTYQRTEAPVTSPLRGEGGHHREQGVRVGMSVRRLTPRECERLQGFPDNYTLIPYKGKLAGDGGRYKTLGNSMAVNVMRFIGERIHRHVEASTEPRPSR